MVCPIEGQLCSRSERSKSYARRFGVLAPALPLLLFGAASGCAVDDRTLLAANAASGGVGSTGGSSGGLGNGFSAGPSHVELPDCIYSTATEVAPGCETMVSNAGFSADTKGWEEEPLSITIGWDQGDASGSDESGSIAVVNAMHGQNDGIAASGGAQCLPAEPGTIYDMAADIFVPGDQGAGFGSGPYVGRAGLSILFWPNASCSIVDRSLIPSYQTDLVEDVEEWTRVEGSAQAPDNAVSMSVRVLTVKPFKAYTFKALFDNVLLQER